MSNEIRSLFDVMSDLEYSGVEIERVLDLVQLFDERMDGDVQWLGRQDTWAADYLEKRLHTLHSLLDTIRIQLSMTHASMLKAVDKGYEINRNLKAAANEG